MRGVTRAAKSKRKAPHEEGLGESLVVDVTAPRCCRCEVDILQEEVFRFSTKEERKLLFLAVRQ